MSPGLPPLDQRGDLVEVELRARVRDSMLALGILRDSSALETADEEFSGSATGKASYTCSGNSGKTPDASISSSAKNRTAPSSVTTHTSSAPASR